jgi:uncharacterized damage-inducible protein DinB
MADDLRYPIGRYQPVEYSDATRTAFIRDLSFLPQDLEIAVQNLDAAQLQTPYREGGWTVQQVVHHVADSHMNAYTRFKLGLTEVAPVIKPYNEKAWALLPDNELPVNFSLTLLHALHTRWTSLLRHLSPADLNRTVYHPEQEKTITLWNLLGLYAWHGRHHTAHITALKDRMGWH